jgi:predicted nucleic acid-binding Zn ribbon protein
MPSGLPEHDHCRFCGDPVPFDRAYCSEKCYWADHAKTKKEKMDNIRFAVLTIVSVAVILVIGVLL